VFSPAVELRSGNEQLRGSAAATDIVTSERRPPPRGPSTLEFGQMVDAGWLMIEASLRRVGSHGSWSRSSCGGARSGRAAPGLAGPVLRPDAAVRRALDAKGEHESGPALPRSPHADERGRRSDLLPEIT
jgi:hypothetical protein